MGNIEVTEAQRKKCTKCKHKEAIQNYWELVLEVWIEKLQEKKEVKEIQS